MKKNTSFLLTILFVLTSFFASAQTVDEIVAKHVEAIGGAANWKKINTMRSEALLSVQGMDIPIVLTGVHNKAFRQEFSAMGMTGYSIITNEGGWNFNPMQGQNKPEPMTADELKYGKDQLDLQSELVDYKLKGHTVEKLDNEEIDGVSCFKLKVIRKSGNETVLLIDPKSYYNIRTVSKVVANGQEVEAIVDMSNFQKLPEGIVIPFNMQNSNMPAPITITKVIINGPVDESIFKVAQ
ncbi:MAG: hypothetical protein RL131_544 [Bacteroidota bacterium]|jgi:hypothetical protein